MRTTNTKRNHRGPRVIPKINPPSLFFWLILSSPMSLNRNNPQALSSKPKYPTQESQLSFLFTLFDNQLKKTKLPFLSFLNKLSTPLSALLMAIYSHAQDVFPWPWCMEGWAEAIIITGYAWGLAIKHGRLARTWKNWVGVLELYGVSTWVSELTTG